MCIRDSEEMCRELATDILHSLGYKVVTCASGEEAIGYYLQSWQEIDLVIMDMNMPRWNGRDTFVALRKINPAIKAILASGYAADVDIRAMRDEGIADFLAKPFTLAEMSEKVSRVLASAGLDIAKSAKPNAAR
ncbi:MAG: response regulator, partial [Planctomycetota bacterium]|nr:response regulator [Planctomycetota bacterium]